MDDAAAIEKIKGILFNALYGIKDTDCEFFTNGKFGFWTLNAIVRLLFNMAIIMKVGRKELHKSIDRVFDYLDRGGNPNFTVKWN